jgi:hypothetical protein
MIQNKISIKQLRKKIIIDLYQDHDLPEEIEKSFLYTFFSLI